MRYGKAAACLVLVLAAVSAQEGAKDELPFVKSWQEAFDRAKAEKKPILICIHKDNEIACERMLGTVYKNADVRRKMREFILVPCSTSAEHRFEGVEPVVHQACDRLMRQRLQSDGLVIAPQHIVVDANEKVLTRRNYEMGANQFVEFMDKGMLYFADPERAAEAESRPAGEADAKPKRSAEIERLIEVILKESDETKKAEQVQQLMTDASDAARQEALLEILARSKEAKQRGYVVRALGKPEFFAAAETIAKSFEDKDSHVRNCAVVTIEEMTNPIVAEKIVALYKKDADAEIKKDCVRAMGPAGGGRDDIKAILLKEIGSGNENMRCAASLSLGFYVSGDEAVVAAYKKKFGGESLKGKTAILWGLGLSGDVGMAKVIEDLCKEERNAQVKELAIYVRKHLGDDTAPEPPKGGGRFGGGRDAGMRLYRLLAPLYTDDKIVRNRVKEFLNRGGPGGGRR